MRYAEHVARVAEKRDMYRFSVGKGKLEALDIDKMIILILNLKK
jgi:hypothetical protein